MAKKFTKLFLGDVVKTVSNRVFRKLTTEAPEDDTIVGTWLFNEYINVNGGAWYAVDFISNGNFYVAMSDKRSQSSNVHDMSLKYFTTPTSYTTAFSGAGTWNNEAYRTIDITAEPTDEEFITWLKANATKQSASTPTIETLNYGQTNGFYSEPVERQFEVGMTWAQFVNSDYNAEQGFRPNYTKYVGAFIINDDGTVSFKGSPLDKSYTETLDVYNGYYEARTKSTDTISSSITYRSTSSPGGSN